MFHSSSESNRLINDPVPKNVSKFPIHQTYLTDDADRTGSGGYKFKAPEVWSSARSGKKSIAIRSIQWRPKTINLGLGISIELSSSSTYSDFVYHKVIPINVSLYDILNDLLSEFNQNDQHLELHYSFNNRTNQLKFYCSSTQDPSTNYKIRFHVNGETTQPSIAFNKLINQPENYFPASSYFPTYENVWDRATALNFHASFVPFDNYQNIGTVFDKWDSPIIYQDPNTSPLFNVWITSDLKTPLTLLHESFIFRFTFIISSENQYHS